MLKLLLPTILFVCLAMAWPPIWSTPYLLTAGGVTIDVGYYAAPCVVDWDGDGVKDLVLGQFGNGNIRFYKNQGTNDNPVFTSFEYLHADGSIITLPYG